ncbi:CLUMA_CG006651, isoform A [Clunio marinus]|uniref:CLUMA_CG006651, isoform A n=1 Tax=Clunio marinus TaxID=568069 RepID=A0A1J1I3K1_9DIPT|nr:CLUMA_CG006651, isoform A [Clunio marinus]
MSMILKHKGIKGHQTSFSHWNLFYLMHKCHHLISLNPLGIECGDFLKFCFSLDILFCELDGKQNQPGIC